MPMPVHCRPSSPAILTISIIEAATSLNLTLELTIFFNTGESPRPQPQPNNLKTQITNPAGLHHHRHPPRQSLHPPLACLRLLLCSSYYFQCFY